MKTLGFSFDVSLTRARRKQSFQPATTQLYGVPLAFNLRRPFFTVRLPGHLYHVRPSVSNQGQTLSSKPQRFRSYMMLIVRVLYLQPKTLRWRQRHQTRSSPRHSRLTTTSSRDQRSSGSDTSSRAAREAAEGRNGEDEEAVPMCGVLVDVLFLGADRQYAVSSISSGLTATD